MTDKKDDSHKNSDDDRIRDDEASAGGNGESHHEMMMHDFRRRFWVSIVLTIPILALAPLIQGFLGIEALLDIPGAGYIQFALSTIVFFYGGRPFLTGLRDELADRRPGMMTLIALAILVAYGYSSFVVFGLRGKVFFWELATLIDVMLLGHWIEMRSVTAASGALEELVKLMPSTAHRLKEDGSTEDVEVAELSTNDRLVVKPGEKIPIDSEIVEGRTSVNEAMLTGESTPVEKGEGDEVIGGSINGESSITVEVKKTGDETYLSQVIDMVRKAQESRSRTQNLADRAAFWLTIVALSVGFVTLAAWLIAGQTFVFSLGRMVTVMVITCPHALGLAIPLVIAVSTSRAAKTGLLIQNRDHFEQMRNLGGVIFDKTGTLTEGRFEVSDITSTDDEEKALCLAASLESRSEHPIAAGIIAAAEERGLDFPAPEDFEAIPGKGARARVDGKECKVVSESYIRDEGIESYDQSAVESLREEGRTIVFVLESERIVGVIGLTDVIREESHEALDELKNMGIRVMMLTGDSEAAARRVASELELDEFFADVRPDEKAKKVREVRDRGMTIAMTGDGVNDAPALAEADVGIAIGAGTDVAVKSADIVLVRSDPRDVVSAITLSRATHRKMVQNLWWASGYNVIAIPLAAGVLAPFGFILPPAAGAIVMSLSTIIVAVNARLLGRNDREGDTDDE